VLLRTNFINMRFIILLTLWNLVICEATSQDLTISIRQFGAKPNDHLSDQKAFNQAAEFINKRKGNVKLIIPEGTYQVGPPYNYKAHLGDIPLARQWDVFSLVNCKNVIIEGLGKTSIKFMDNIPFGCVPYRADKKDSSVHIGTLFRFTSCNNIALKNINTHGNNIKFRLLNNWGVGVNPYEREHEGLFVLNCQKLQVENCNFNYFGRDGVIIIQDEDKQQTRDISFRNCNFNYNGRDGLSWCGGENVSFYNCQFSYNASGRIVTNPASGIDIEPERNGTCKNGKFIKCSFVSNGGYGIVSMNANETSTMLFDSCKIYGNYNYSIVTNSPKVKFTNSEFAGTAIFSYDASSEEMGMKIINCTFRDSLPGKKVFRGGYMLSITGRYIRFSNCIFKSYVVPSLYTEIRKKSKNDHPENTIFLNCIFDANFRKKSTWDEWAFLVSHSHFVGCTFKSSGIADFKGILGQGEKNIYQKNSRFVKQ
jgi:hypothetical protein